MIASSGSIKDTRARALSPTAYLKKPASFNNKMRHFFQRAWPTSDVARVARNGEQKECCLNSRLSFFLNPSTKAHAIYYAASELWAGSGCAANKGTGYQGSGGHLARLAKAGALNRFEGQKFVPRPRARRSFPRGCHDILHRWCDEGLLQCTGELRVRAEQPRHE